MGFAIGAGPKGRTRWLYPSYDTVYCPRGILAQAHRLIRIKLCPDDIAFVWRSIRYGRSKVLHKMTIALLVLAAVGLASSTGASARGGHGGSFHHGGGWHGGGFGGFGWGYGPWGYPYDDGYPAFYGRGCYEVRQRVLTRYGWRIRRVSICE